MVQVRLAEIWATDGNGKYQSAVRGVLHRTIHTRKYDMACSKVEAESEATA